MSNPEMARDRGNFFRRNARQIVFGGAMILGGGAAGLSGGASVAVVLNNMDRQNLVDHVYKKGTVGSEYHNSLIRQQTDTGIAGLALLSIAAISLMASNEARKRMNSSSSS